MKVSLQRIGSKVNGLAIGGFTAMKHIPIAREVIEKQGDYEVAFRWFPSKQKAEDFCLGRIQGTL